MLKVFFKLFLLIVWILVNISVLLLNNFLASSLDKYAVSSLIKNLCILLNKFIVLINKLLNLLSLSFKINFILYKKKI